jgi:hypothetical protein
MHNLVNVLFYLTAVPRYQTATPKKPQFNLKTAVEICAGAQLLLGAWCGEAITTPVARRSYCCAIDVPATRYRAAQLRSTT